ncbi:MULTISPECIES: hypothetical protein [Nonomuraea]|uniref:Uncharacterized protein n=1 Tax=Nonomuraea mangrovi TaxID=2316207 RepID=A0ABW4T4P6_9ACTN
MTQQYLAGELSLLLGRLQTATANDVSARAVGRLRHEAETQPIIALTLVARRALALTDTLCWESLARQDPAAFIRQAEISAALHELGVCAGWLEQD